MRIARDHKRRVLVRQKSVVGLIAHGPSAVKKEGRDVVIFLTYSGSGCGPRVGWLFYGYKYVKRYSPITKE